MFPGLDPKQLEKLMRQMGANIELLPARRVTIELEDAPQQVVQVRAQGQTTFQVIGGNLQREDIIKEEDIQLVMEKTSSSRDEAVKALKEAKGDIAEAILKLASTSEGK